MIKRIMLVNPPMRLREGSLRRISEPLGLLSIATYLTEKDYEVDVFDMALEGYDNISRENGDVIYGSSTNELLERIAAFGPDMVGISCIFTFQIDIVLKLCEEIKNTTGVYIVVGGGVLKRNKEKFIESENVDFCILGEGELRLAKFIENINGNAPDTSCGIDGICYKDSSGKTITKEPISFIENLDAIPFPRRSFVDMEKYIRIGRPNGPYHLGDRVAIISTSKGCPCNCTFCNFKDIAGNTVRNRSVGHVLDEIEYLVKTYGIDEIQFVDENLNVNKQRAKTLFREMKKYGLKWCTPTGLFFNAIDDEMLELMAASGAYQITFAIESASKRVLKDIMRKDVAIERCKAVVDKAHSLGMFVHAFFLVGMPGETKEETLKTLEFPILNNIDSASFNIACAYEGSELYEFCAEKGFLQNSSDLLSTRTFSEVTNIVIPEDSEYYSMEPEQLAALVRQASEKLNLHVKEKFPDIWEQKYGRFLKLDHETYIDKIMFRG